MPSRRWRRGEKTAQDAEFARHVQRPPRPVNSSFPFADAGDLLAGDHVEGDAQTPGAAAAAPLDTIDRFLLQFVGPVRVLPAPDFSLVDARLRQGMRKQDVVRRLRLKRCFS